MVRLRVAVVLSELRPGGMERVVVHLAKGLVTLGVEPIVVCMENAGALAPELGEAGICVHAIGSKKSRDLGAVLRLYTLLRKFKPHMINNHDYASIPYTVLANLLAIRAPVIFTSHGLLFEGFEELRQRYRFFSKFLSGLSAVSGQVADRHREYLGWGKSIAIIRNGVPEIERDPALRGKVREELGCEPGDVIFLSVGNPRPEKGFEDLVDAATILRNEMEKGIHFVVAIAGKMNGSDYCQMLNRRIQSQGTHSFCRFLGFRDDMKALYSGADVFVLSSRSEGLPMVVLESMMSGLPVIATRVGGVPDAVGDNGLLVDPAKPHDLAEAMKRLLSDAGLRKTLAEKAAEEARSRFGVNRMVAEYLDLYQKHVRDRRR